MHGFWVDRQTKMPGREIEDLKPSKELALTLLNKCEYIMEHHYSTFQDLNPP
jgi:hypothetical protein